MIPDSMTYSTHRRLWQALGLQILSRLELEVFVGLLTIITSMGTVRLVPIQLNLKNKKSEHFFNSKVQNNNDQNIN